MKKRQLIELIIALYTTQIGIGLAISTLIVSIYMGKVSPFEVSITILLVGLSYYIIRGGIETSVVTEFKKENKTLTTTISIEEERMRIRERLRNEVGVDDEKTLNKIMESVEQYLHDKHGA